MISPRIRTKPELRNDILNQMITENQCQTSRALVERLHVGHTTVLDHLHQLNSVSKLYVWVLMTRNMSTT